MPESISAGPTTDLKGHMSRAFVLAATPQEQKTAAGDKDLKRMNELLSQIEPDGAARKEIRQLRQTLEERYPEPALEEGQKVYAAQDDEYTRRAWELQTGGRDGIGVRHTVAKTKLGGIFANEAAANAFTYHGAYPYEVTADEDARTVRAIMHKFVDGMFAPFRG